MKKPSQSRPVLSMAGLLLLFAALPGCSADSASAGYEGDQPLRIILVANAPTSEPFASIAANGFEQAGEDFNLDVVWRGPTQPNPSDPSEGVRLIQNAIASQPDGLIISDAFPDQFNPLIQSAVDEGIPVVLFSAGWDQVDKTEALAFVGNDEVAAGQLAGEHMDELGSDHTLVVTFPPGDPVADDRTNGFIEGFDGEVTTLRVPPKDINDTTKVRNLLEIELGKDSSIDGVWPIGTGFGAPVLAAYDSLGDRADSLTWGQLGLDEPTLEALAEGKYSFSVDQQQYLQGYLPAMWLHFHLRYGMRPPDQFIRTGPSLVEPDDADSLITLNEEQIR